MKQVKWQTIVVVGLALTLGLNIIFGRSSLKEAKRITKELELRIDTLQAVEDEYSVLQKRYVDLYDEFATSREQIDQFRQKISEISTEQNASVGRIRNELKELILKYDTLEIAIPLDTVSLDSLRF
ncbi:hypothetical protein [Ekhidna sp.]